MFRQNILFTNNAIDRDLYEIVEKDLVIAIFVSIFRTVAVVVKKYSESPNYPIYD